MSAASLANGQAVLQERRSSLPQDIARTILAGFDKHYRLFREAAVQAKALYQRAAWAEMRELARRRIQMYDLRVEEAVAELLENFPQAARDESLWPAVKLAYIGLLHEHRQRFLLPPARGQRCGVHR